MFDLNVRFQITAIIVLTVIIIDYYRNPHLKVLSAKFFQLLLWMTALNLIFDVITVYTITHIDKVDSAVNRACHQLFIASIVLVLFMNYMYIIILGNGERRLKKKTVVLSVVPLFCSFIIVLTGKLNYYIGKNYAYSYGQMVYVVFGCGFIYLIIAYIMTLFKKSYFTKEQKTSIRFGLVIWAVFLSIQIIFPQYLLSGMGFVILVLSIYFSYENPKENYDVEANCFNKSAFHKMMSEYYQNKNVLYIVNVVFVNYESVNSNFGHETGMKAMRHIVQQIRYYYNGNIYHSRSNVLSLFIDTDILDYTNKLNELSKVLSLNNFQSVNLECRINVIDVCKYSASQDEVYELINFVSNKIAAENNSIYYVDEEIINKKKRYDKIEQILTWAVANDGFEMFYQPIYWPEYKTFKSAEALIRLKTTSELGFISPEEFIPIAEEKGLIITIGDMVVDMVSNFIKENQLEKHGIEYMEVNLSGIQACAPDIAKRLQAILLKNNVKPSMINL